MFARLGWRIATAIRLKGYRSTPTITLASTFDFRPTQR